MCTRGPCASMTRMAHDLLHPAKARRGERIAVLSPSFAAPAVFPAVHEQAMRRLTDVTGLVPVEYPTTRMAGAAPGARAADINAAFADPAIRGILAVIGGEDQITVVPHLDAELALRDPKPFLGMSDNTNLHHWLWANGVASFYGGSSQVHLGPGPGVDDVHARSLRAALVSGGTLEITDPGESEDIGVDWGDPRALSSFGNVSRPNRGAGTARHAQSPGAPGAAAWRSSNGSSPPGGSPSIRTSSTVACSSSRPRRTSSPRATWDGSSGPWASAASSRRSMRSCWRARQCLTSPTAHLPRNAPSCAGSSVMSSLSSLATTTLKPSYAPASRLATRARNGSSRTAAPSPSTAPRAGWPPTTPDTERGHPHRHDRAPAVLAHATVPETGAHAGLSWAHVRRCGRPPGRGSRPGPGSRVRRWGRYRTRPRP
jgi:LD-carboxypeptidase N-terminal domain